MKQPIFAFKATALAVLTIVTAFFSACDSEVQTLRFGSGNKSGLYDKFAGSFAEQFNKANDNAKILIKNTEGTSANIRLIEEGFLNIAIVQADILKDYLIHSRKRHAIAAVAGLYTESIQIVVAAESDIKSVEDLTGKKVAVGEQESGVLRNAEIILKAYGIPFSKIEAKNLSFRESTKALQSGEIDAFFCTAGTPTPSIKKLATSKKIRILSLDSTSIERIENLHPELSASIIPTRTYAGQDSSIRTLGTKAILVVNQMLDNAIVTKITETAHAKTTANLATRFKTNDEAAEYALEFATKNVPVGFHPGAAAFFANKNIKVPEVPPLKARTPTPSTGD